VTVNGEIVATYPDCGYTPIKASSVGGISIPTKQQIANDRFRPEGDPLCPGNASGCVINGNQWTGWAEWTEQDDSVGWGSNTAYGYVPAYPTNLTATYGYFTGWESTTTNCTQYILQPVLQFGGSPAGGGSGKWYIGVWFWGGPGQFFEGVSQVSPGDKIQYLMWLDPVASRYWTEIYDLNSAAYWDLYVGTGNCSMNRSFVTMEVSGNNPYLASCNQVPQSPSPYVDFFNITMTDFFGYSVTYNPGAAAPISYQAGAPLNSCGFAMWSGNFGGGFGYGSTLWQ
jgi:hypothetical protein